MIPNIYLSDEQIKGIEKECYDAFIRSRKFGHYSQGNRDEFLSDRTQVVYEAISKAAADNAVKKVVEQLDSYKQLAGKRIYITAEHPNEWVELEEHELSVVVVIPIDDWQALKKLAT